MMKNIREEIQEKIKELERRNQVRSLELIEWLNGLLAMLPEEEKDEDVKLDFVVEIPEGKSTPKKKVVFKKKK